jgi:mRNA interferase MazF
VRTAAGFGESSITSWKEAGLLKPSVIKPVLATMERGLVLRKLGTLAPTDLASLRSVLGTILGD